MTLIITILLTENCGEEKMARKKKRAGLWANIHAKRKRIKRGSGERMRKPGSKGAPTLQSFRQSAKKKRRKKRK